jgi:hypothetical protein
MTWSLNASGHTPKPEDAETWAEVEQELHDELQTVLSNPKYGATSSTFAGNHVHGQPHVAHDATPTEDQSEDAPTHHQHHS